MKKEGLSYHCRPTELLVIQPIAGESLAPGSSSARGESNGRLYAVSSFVNAPSTCVSTSLHLDLISCPASLLSPCSLSDLSSTSETADATTPRATTRLHDFMNTTSLTLGRTFLLAVTTSST